MQKVKDNIMMKMLPFGSRVHDTADRMLQNDRPQLILTSVLSFAAVLFVVRYVWPIYSLMELLYSLVLMVFVFALIIFATKYIFTNAVLFIARLSQPLSDSYRELNEKRKRAGVKVLGMGPKAEVTIKYFIEQEKDKKVYNAKYIGPI